MITRDTPVDKIGIQDRISRRLREHRAKLLREMIKDVHSKRGKVRIIDVGGTEDYWSLFDQGFLEECRVRITIVNLRSGARGDLRSEIIDHQEGDGCDLSQFEDRYFDIAHSNSVIEHVGSWSNMKRFAAEISRTAASYFVQTPSFWFPIEPHFLFPFFHWLPVPTRIWLVTKFTLGGRWGLTASSTDEAARLVESASLLNRRMLEALFSDATIVTERFALLPKSLIAIRHVN